MNPEKQGEIAQKMQAEQQIFQGKQSRSYQLFENQHVDRQRNEWPEVVSYRIGNAPLWAFY